MSVPPKRQTVRVSPEMRDRLQGLVEEGKYPNRSEAIREALRRLFRDEGVQEDR